MQGQLHRCLSGSSPLERVPAVDGATIDADRLLGYGLLSKLGHRRLQAPEAHQVWGMDLNFGAVGCALSHLWVWAHIAAAVPSAEDIYLVLEDDCLFPENFEAVCERRLQLVPPDWQLVYISGLDTANQCRDLQVAEGVCRVPQYHRTTNAYAMKQSAALPLIHRCFPLTFQLDTMMTIHATTRDRCGLPYVTSPVSYTLQPPVVVQATRMGSDIQAATTEDAEAVEARRCRDAGWKAVPSL